MVQSAHCSHQCPRHLSFKGTLQLLNAFIDILRHSLKKRITIMTAHLLGAIAKLRLPHRPGRVEPRAIKRRPKSYPLLMVPRHAARVKLLRQREKWA